MRKKSLDMCRFEAGNRSGQQLFLSIREGEERRALRRIGGGKQGRISWWGQHLLLVLLEQQGHVLERGVLLL